MISMQCNVSSMISVLLSVMYESRSLFRPLSTSSTELLFLCMSAFSLPVACLSVCLLPACPTIFCLSVYMLLAYLSVCLLSCPSIACLSVACLSVCLSVACLFVYIRLPCAPITLCLCTLSNSWHSQSRGVGWGGGIGVWPACSKQIISLIEMGYGEAL